MHLLEIQRLFRILPAKITDFSPFSRLIAAPGSLPRLRWIVVPAPEQTFTRSPSVSFVSPLPERSLGRLLTLGDLGTVQRDNPHTPRQPSQSTLFFFLNVSPRLHFRNRGFPFCPPFIFLHPNLRMSRARKLLRLVCPGLS